MAFSLESQLCSALVNEWPRRFGAKHTVNILREVRVGTLIPDLVAFHSWAPAKPQVQLPVLTLFESTVVSALVRRPRRISGIASQLFTRADRVQAVLDRLVRRGLAKTCARGIYSLARGSIPARTEVIAVEAKLTRWREAVAQARRY